ncbi:hypothetical protein [Alcanivorax sp.]|uniref:hypothetical protein n=1 Tax=Alcanivorax sp. TaxID=1872427 RepID=UPI002B267022|nr:hypothetical protein [Alcanivorax sp.]
MNVKVCYLLPVFTLVTLLSGCADKPVEETQDSPLHVQKLDKATLKATGSENQARALPDRIAQLDLYQAPKTLAGLQFDGEISSEHARTLRYRDADGKEQLSLTLSGLPTGWDTMQPQRAVAGYYSELRQRRVDKALSNSANALSIISERLVDLEGNPSAQAQMRWVEPNRPIQNQALLVTLIDDNFIRISNASYRQKTVWLLQQTKRVLAEFKAAQTAP